MLPDWIVEPFALSYLTPEQMDADDLTKLYVAYLFGDCVDLWLKTQGRRGRWQEDLADGLPVFYPLTGEPTNDGPPREILAQAFADGRRNERYGRWFRALGIAHDSDEAVA